MYIYIYIYRSMHVCMMRVLCLRRMPILTRTSCGISAAAWGLASTLNDDCFICSRLSQWCIFIFFVLMTVFLIFFVMITVSFRLGTLVLGRGSLRLRVEFDVLHFGGSVCSSVCVATLRTPSTGRRLAASLFVVVFCYVSVSCVVRGEDT